MSELALPATAWSGGTRLDFARILAGSSHDLLSGSLLVAGDPGGSFHLRSGAIVEVTSPGAPGVDTLLLRSGRVSEADWASVVRAAAADGAIGVELVSRELIGAAELQLICVMAALDGALAVGMGRIDGLTLDHDPGDRGLAAPEGIEPEWLLRETERRITALNSSGLSISPFHDRLTRTNAGAAWLSGCTAGERREILRRADCRRSARDIAFLLGRSLYAVTVEVSRMLNEGLIETVPALGNPPASALGSDPGPTAERPPGAAQAPRLPHRLPGASGINDVLPLRPVSARWQPPPALLRRYGAADEQG
ncbi:MarR family transcriptional regulator [Kitasatospora sp. NPDC097643]|uniref:MarR family transcriptional regulator n=1 Tax=Kitasatospora sp. NPDC097643 TaxID=3157230 RepID=UPI00331EB80E